MREILFKAKRKDNGEWVEGHLIQSPYMGGVRSWISTPEDKTRLRAIATYYGDWRAVEVSTDTICQYTGLTDKNGNKIWENDIISYPKIYAKGKVIFMEDTFVLFDEYEVEQYINGIWNEFEVIGNIFDNPELLKGE